MPALWLAFTLSGAAALIAEQVFEKLLSTLVGASTPASAVVLAVYFAGLTTGALAYSRLRRAAWSPLAVYAALELAVVAACAGLAWKFESLVPAFAPLLRLGVGNPALLTLLRGVVAAAWILPLTVPMGATFPAIVDAADRIAPEAQSRAVNVLYALNLVGAIAAALAGPLLLFPRVGMSGGLALVCVFDVVAALLALVVAARAAPRDPVTSETQPGSGARAPGHLLAFAAITGLLLFSLEVVWTHLACAVLGTSVYAFAWMLGSVLVGLGVGSVASAVLFRRTPGGRAPAWAPAAALLAGAIVLAFAHAAWPYTPHALAILGSRAQSFLGAELARFAVAAALLVPPASVLGLAYPLLFRAVDFPDAERGGVAGQIAAANALGCIAGALVTGFVVLPSFGSEATEAGLVVLAAASGAIAAMRDPSARVRRSAPLVAAFATALVVFAPRWPHLKLTAGEHVYFRTQFDPATAQLLSFHEDTRGGITAVVSEDDDASTRTRTRTLLTNGKFQGNDASEMSAQNAFALVPTQYVSHFDRALVIGLGTGRSAHVVHAMDFASLDIAELAPGIVAAARDSFAHVNGHVLDAPNVSLLLEDGRNVLLLREETYDLVTIELTSVWFAGATNLYSREFYALVQGRLRPGGVMQEWIQLHHIGMPEITSVLATVHDVFPYASVFYVGGQTLVVASMTPQEPTSAFAEELHRTGAWHEMGAADEADAKNQLAAARLLAPADVERIASHSWVTHNTDANRYLEYATPRYNHLADDQRYANLAALQSEIKSPPGATGEAR